MRNIYRLVLAAAVCCMAAEGISSCTGDNELEKKVESLEDRLSSLEQAVQDHAEKIAVLLSGDCITEVVKNADGSYRICFLRHEAIVLRPGAKGDNGTDGATPVVSVEQDGDGNWYWKVNGQWLLDQNGSRVRANGMAGSSSEVTATPSFKIEHGYWYVSLDNGATWQQAGQAAPGADGSYFSDIDLSDPCSVKLTLVDGSSFIVPRYASLRIGEGIADSPLLCSPGVETEISIVLPTGLTSDNYAALKAKIDYSGGSAVDVVTRAAPGWELKIHAPSFAQDGSCNNDAYITVMAPESAQDDVLLELSLVLKDGTTSTVSQILSPVLVPVVEYSLLKVGTYTLEFACAPSRRCRRYAATMVSAGPGGPYDKAPQGSLVAKTDFDEMRRDIITQFTESLAPAHDPYAFQPYLTLSEPHVYTEADLVKATPYTSNACAGYDKIFPGANPFAVWVMWEDVSGNIDCEYVLVSAKTLKNNRCSLEAAMELTDVSINSFEAAISCPGAAKMIVYMSPGQDYPAELSDNQKLELPLDCSDTIHYTPVGMRLSPDKDYYLVAVPIDSEGRVGVQSVLRVHTPSYELQGSARVESVTIPEPQRYCSELGLRLSVSSGATAVRIFSMSSFYFKATCMNPSSDEAYSGTPYQYVTEMLLDDYNAISRSEHRVPSGGVLDCTLALSPCAQSGSVFWDSNYALWACVQDSQGRWSAPQNLACLLIGNLDEAAADVYVPVITEDAPVSFSSDGTLSANPLCQSATAELPLVFETAGLSSVRVFACELDSFIMFAVDGSNKSYPLTKLVSDVSFKSLWTDYTLDGDGRFETVMPVVPGRKYVLVAAGMDASGAFTRPLNLAASADDAFVSYFNAVNYQVPAWYEAPLSIGNDDALWLGKAGVFSELSPATDGAGSGGLVLKLDRDPEIDCIYTLYASTQSLDADALYACVKEAFPDIYTSGRTSGTLELPEDKLGSTYYLRQSMASAWGDTITIRSYSSYWSGRTMIFVFVDKQGCFNINAYIKCIDGVGSLSYFSKNLL